MTPQPVLSLDAIKATIAETNALFNTEVVGKRNYAALDDVYTKEACILPPDRSMVKGREAIKDFWSMLIESANGKSVILQSVEVIPSGDSVLEIGKAHLTIEVQGRDVYSELKYLVYWRQEDGRWKWHVDMWNRNA